MERRSCDFIIFGIMGDLAQRKLLPSLYQLEKSGQLNYDTRIIGVARHELDQEAFQAEMRKKLEKFVEEPLEQKAAEQLLARMHYVLIHLDRPEQYNRLCQVTNQHCRVMVNYFSVAPSLFGDICTGLDHAGLIFSPLGRSMILWPDFFRKIRSTGLIIIWVRKP